MMQQDAEDPKFVQQDAEEHIETHMKQNFASERKRKRTPKEPWEPKSKGKEIMSDKPKKSSGKGKRTRVCDIYDDVEDQYSCMERAAILMEHLDDEVPRFVKCMLPSNVLYSFWLILPKKFCVMHLPMHDTTITLVDESGKEFKTNFLKERHGLSAGWRGFSNSQRLLQGDILFFLLVGPCKLQVHIVRRYGIEAVEAASCLMEMQPRPRRTRASNFDKELKAKKDSSKHKEAKSVKAEPILKEAKKGKRSRRCPKMRIGRPPPDVCATQGDIGDGQRAKSIGSKLSADHCDTSSHSEAFSSEVFQGSSSGMVNHLQPDELGCCARNMCYHEGITCQSAARRIYSSSTVAT